ncbi:hypothetical protein [Enterococcus sp. UD-01]|jgi:hypothetical protein|uniref:hypothetical protein n=1 Tax=Enterococcus sp. UD-01 TaxID=3373911 RepID=UPI00383955CA
MSYGPIPDRYPSIMYDLSPVGMSAAQASAAVSKLISSGSVDLVAWKELQNKPDFKIKGQKRNGSLTRQQAFGQLFKNH